MANTFTANALPLINIASSDMEVSYSGNETDIVPVTQAELNVGSVSYSSAKAVVQKDSILFWSNLADNSNRFDSVLQEFANNITIDYFINEVEYKPSSREKVATGGFGLESLPYTDSTENPALHLYLRYNEAVNLEASNLASNYRLDIGSTDATAYIDITDASVLDGDTITVTNNLGSSEVFMGTGGPPDPLTFNITSGNAVTIAAAFAEVINNESTLLIASVIGTLIRISPRIAELGAFTNDFTLAYAATATAGVSLIEEDEVTTGNPINLTGGADGFSVFPIDILGNVDDASDSSLITLVYDVADIPLGISSKDVLESNTTRASDGQVYTSWIDEITSSRLITNVEELGAFNDYKSEFLTFYQKGYMRNEVYALGIMATFNDAASTFNYAIPGNHKSATTTTGAIPTNPGVWTDASTGILGTYVSQQDNPTNQHYPANAEGDDPLC